MFDDFAFSLDAFDPLSWLFDLTVEDKKPDFDAVYILDERPFRRADEDEALLLAVLL